jgi:hypothetical protein
MRRFGSTGKRRMHADDASWGEKRASAGSRAPFVTAAAW